jgi:hypothetical protein
MEGVKNRGFAACCAESLRLSGKRPNQKTLLFSLLAGWAGKAEPFRTAGGKAAIHTFLGRGLKM